MMILLNLMLAMLLLTRLSLIEKLTGQTGHNCRKNVEIMVPSKHINNFWRTLEMLFISYEINLISNWSANCAIKFSVINHVTTFAITEKKLYVPVVTLSIGDHAKLLQQYKDGFKRTTNWNKCKSKEMIFWFLEWSKFSRSK